MADTKLSALTELNATPATGDELYIRDVSEGTSDESKRITVANLVAAASSAVTREGGQTTEATTTSTSPADMLSATSLTIAAVEPFLLSFGARQTTGASDDGHLGLKINTTTVYEAISTGNPNIWRSTAGNVAVSGGGMAMVSARVTNYIDGNVAGVITGNSTAQASARNSIIPGNNEANAFPNAEVTSVILRGHVDNASTTQGADELQVYSLTAS